MSASISVDKPLTSNQHNLFWINLSILALVLQRFLKTKPWGSL